MHVRPVSVDGDLRPWHAVFERGWLHERPWEFMSPLRHYEVVLRNPLSSEHNEGFAAYDGDELVGCGTLCILLDSNTDKVEFDIAVPAEHRRRGVGRALVEYAVDRARGAGATFALTTSSYPFAERATHGYRRFAEAVGFSIDLEEVHRTLALPVEPALLHRLAAEAAPCHQDYAITTWVDGVPEKYVDSYLHCSNQLPLDAPMGEVEWTEGGLDRKSYAEEQAFLRETGRRRYTTVALSPTDEVVAFTDLVLREEGSTKVGQWGTLVRRDHRGHKLGTAVKVANLAAMQQAHPDHTQVETTNAEVNAAMIGINEELGFRAVAVHPCFYTRLR